MSLDELLIIERLKAVNLSNSQWAKRFIGNIYSVSKDNPNIVISDNQREWLYRYLYKYRKQMPVTYKKFKDHPHCKAVKK